MIERFLNATNMEKGLFVMAVGIIGVFFVLIMFYLLIKVLTKMFPEKDNQ